MVITRKYATATAAGTHIRIPIVKRGAVDFALSADWTPAAGDVKISKDGGAQANIGTLPTFTNGMWQFQLTAAELTAKQVEILVVDAATKAVEDQAVLVETFGHASAMYPIDLSAANPSVNVAAMSADVLTSSALATSARDEIADAVWDEAAVEPVAVPAVTASFRSILAWLHALSRNKVTQTGSTTTLRNDSDSGNIATSAVSDTGATFIAQEWS